MSGDKDVPPDLSDQTCYICSNPISYKNANRINRCANDSCNVVMHIKCFELVAKVFYINKVNWRCRNCADQVLSEEILPCADSVKCDQHMLHKEIGYLKHENTLLNKRISDLEYTVLLQKDKIDSVSAVKTVSIASYSDKVKGPQNISHVVKTINNANMERDKFYTAQQNSAVLFIKSTDPNINVEQELKNKINPANLNICVNKIKPIKSGILVNCVNKNSLDKLTVEIDKQFGGKLNVNAAKKFDPRLIIKGVDKNITSGDFIRNEIIEHNSYFQMPNKQIDIKVVVVIKRKFSNDVVIEVSSNLRELIMSHGYLYIGWQKVRVEDHFLIKRCYRCAQFGHLRKDCKNSTPVCSTCSENHETKDCNNSESKRCINCFNYCRRYPKSTGEICVDHTADDKNNCFCYHKQLTVLKNKINYGEDKLES